MRRFKLERQADAIEAVLSSHKIQGRVWGGTVTPRFIRYDMTAAVGTRVQKVLALREEIALSLGVADIRLYRKGGAIRVEVPRDELSTVKLEKLITAIETLPSLTAILGVDEEGVPLLLRLPSPDVAHILIAGTTGSGKSALLRSILLSLAMHNPQRVLQVLFIDPKGRSSNAIAPLPHLIRPPISEPQTAIKLLSGMVTEMERRDREKRSRPALVIAVDELADLRMSCGQVVEQTLSRLTQRGREAGIHVILSTQRPASQIVGGLVKANLPVRLVGAVGSPEDAKVATGIAGSGAERLRGRGDFLLVTRGQSIRFQSAFVSDSAAARIAQGLSEAQRSGRGMPLRPRRADASGVSTKAPGALHPH